MKVPMWTEITQAELLSKTADELHEFFGSERDSTETFDKFCEQEDVSFELAKKVAIWGTFGPPDNRHDLQWVKLIDCTTEHIRNIRRERWSDDDLLDRIMVGILVDRGEYSTCENCEFIGCEHKDDPKNNKYFCKYNNDIQYYTSFVCEHWQEANSPLSSSSPEE